MNDMTNPQTMVPSAPQKISSLLATVATVASVTTSCLGLGRQDKKAGEESARAHNAKVGISRVTVSRLAGAEDRVKEIKDCQTEGGNILKRKTSAWGERRLLPNVNIQIFLEEWSANKNEHDRLVKAFIADAPQLIEKAGQDKGTFEIKLPTVEEIEKAFALDFVMEQVPDAAKFTSTTLDKQIEQALRDRFEADIAASYQQAQKDAITRLATPLANLVDRMEKYEKREEDKDKGLDVGREGYFRDTIISNITEVGNVFASFNLTGDPVLAKVAAMVQGFDGIEAKDLRNNKGLRDNTAERAKLILAQLGDWL